MIYEVELADGRIIEVEAEPGQQKEAVLAAKKYLAKEAGGKILNESQLYQSCELIKFITDISDCASFYSYSIAWKVW